MVLLKSLIEYTDALLDVGAFQDYAPNGLQVQGRDSVHHLVTGVTASLALIDAAVERGADAILVHHGYFWKGEDPCVTGMKRARLQRLLQADVSLLAYHLPLDAHPTLGNNAQLAKCLGVQPLGRFGPGAAPAWYGELAQPVSSESFAETIAQSLGRAPLHVPGGPRDVRRIGWCTGAAQDYILDAAVLGLDAYVSGEISERTVHVARELGIHFFAAGHHATERFGAKALGAHLAEKFGIRHEFVDIPNPA